MVQFFTYPYLLRTLGTSQFGLIAFANVVTAQLILLTEFGFGSSATRLVAIHRDDLISLNRVFNAVMGVKLLLLGIAAVVMLLFLAWTEKYQAERNFFLLAFLQVLGTTLLPTWLFQGLERMRLVSIISMMTRICSAGAILLLVHKPSDATTAIACQSIAVTIQGIIALWMALRIAHITVRIPSTSEMWEQAKDSLHPFLGSSLGNLLGGSSVLFLGMFKDLTTVGTYAAIERTARAEVMALLPATQATYPHISQRFHQSLEHGNRAIRKLCFYLLTATALFVGSISLFSRPILHLLYGNKLLDQSSLFSTFSIWSFFSLSNTLLGLHYLIASGHAKEYGRSVFWSSILTVALFLTLIPKFGGWGSLTAVIAGELLQTGMMLSVIVRINRVRPNQSPNQAIG